MEISNSANRNLKLLNVLTFLSSFRAYEGVLAIYFASVSGSFALGMTVFAAMHLSASVFEVPTGIFSDHIGRKKTLILFYLSGVIGVSALYVAGSAPMLIFGAVMIGLSIAMRSGTLNAFVYENLSQLGRENDFKKVEGFRVALNRYSGVIAGLMGAAFIFLFDIRAAILLALVFKTGALALSFFIKDIKHFEFKKANIYSDLVRAWNGFVHDAALRNIGIGKMLARGMGNVDYRFRSLFFSTIMPDWVVNVIVLLNNFVAGIAMQSTHWVVRKIGITRSLVHVEIIDRFLVSGLVLVNTITASAFMNVTSGIAYGIRSVASEDLLQSRYSKDRRAIMGSLVGLGGSVIYSAMAILVGLLADYIGLLQTMLLIQFVFLVPSIFFYRGIKLGNHT